MMDIRELKFKEVGHQCLEADATWNVLGNDAGSYEVSPLIDDDSRPFAWEANYYTDHGNAHGFSVDREKDEYATKEEAINACQKHNKERCISMIEEMLA